MHLVGHGTPLASDAVKLPDSRQAAATEMVFTSCMLKRCPGLDQVRSGCQPGQPLPHHDWLHHLLRLRLEGPCCCTTVAYGNRRWL
jgi:hypothetical protein